MDAEALSKDEPFENFEVIIREKEVIQLLDENLMKTYLEKAKKLGAVLNACSYSLNKFGMDQTKVPLKKVENGILYNLQLQKKGYISLKL